MFIRLFVKKQSRFRFESNAQLNTTGVTLIWTWITIKDIFLVDLYPLIFNYSWLLRVRGEYPWIKGLIGCGTIKIYLTKFSLEPVALKSNELFLSPRPPIPPLAIIISWLWWSTSAIIFPVSESLILIPVGTFRTILFPFFPHRSFALQCVPDSALIVLYKTLLLFVSFPRYHTTYNWKFITVRLINYRVYKL